MIIGLGVLVLAAAYYAAASAIPQSLLADEVGADGVPKLLAIALAILGALQLVRALRLRSAAGGGDEEIAGARRHARAVGMLAIGIVYVLVTPYLGYPLALAGLILAVGVYAGIRPSLYLTSIAVAGGGLFWIMFVKLLGVAMPVGGWARLVL